jgi:hypothetical protein
MKNKSLKLRLSYFFRQQIQGKDSYSSGNMPEWVKSASEWERAESVIIEDILRWADDGGKMLDLPDNQARSNPDAAGNGQTNDAWQRIRKR